MGASTRRVPRAALLLFVSTIGCAAALWGMQTSALAGPPVGPVATGIVAGIITSRTGAPIAGAQVELKSQFVDKTTTSTGDGHFTFRDVPPDTYYVIASAKLFQRVLSTPFTVLPGQSVAVSVEMEPAGSWAITTLGRVTVRAQRMAPTAATPTVIISNQTYVEQGNLQVEGMLDKMPGVSVDYGYAGQMPSSFAYLSIRGAGAGGNSYENVVLEDGEPIRAGGYGVDISGITSALYSDTEVVKGVSGSSLQGADSVGGTLNMVTRDPTKSEGGQTLTTFGTWGRSDANLVESNTIGRVGYVLDFHVRAEDGYNPKAYYDYIPPTWYYNAPTTYDRSAVGHLGIPSETAIDHSYFGKVHYKLSNTSYLVATYEKTVTFDDYSGAAPVEVGVFFGTTCNSPPSYTSNPGCTGHPADPLGYPYLTGEPGIYNWYGKPKYSYEFHSQVAGGDLSLKWYHHYILNTFSEQNVPADACCFVEYNDDALAGSIVSWSKHLGTAHTLTLTGSGDADHYYLAYQYYGPYYGQYGAYDLNSHSHQMEHEYLVKDEYQPNGKLDLTLAFFHSSIDALDLHRTDPKLNIVYHPNSLESFHASVGSGFAAPPITDRTTPIYLTYGYTEPVCPQSEPACAAYGGNPYLKEERAVGFDFGFQRNTQSGAQLAIDLYRTNLYGHLYLGVIPAPPGLTFSSTCVPGCAGLPVLYLYTYTNLVKAVYQGGEASAHVPFGQPFSLDVAYNVQSAFPSGVSTLVESLNTVILNNQQLYSVPLHKYYASLNYRGRSSGPTAYVSWNFFDKNSSFGVAPFSVYNMGATLPVNGNDKLHVIWSNIFNANFPAQPFYGYYCVHSPYGCNFGDIFYRTAAPDPIAYSGYGGYAATQTTAAAPHQITVTYEHRWGSMSGGR